MGGKAKNIEKPLVFLCVWHFWEAWKRCLRHLEGCLGQFRNIFGHVGDKMACKRDKMATKRANMATKSAKMSQHERECGSRFTRVFCKCYASVVMLTRAEGVGPLITY